MLVLPRTGSRLAFYDANQNIVSITDRNGKVLYKYERPEPNEPAYTEDAAYYMVDMLQEVINSGTGRNLRANYGITAQLGGKTGTTQNNTDGWFVGFTPSLVAGAWVGADQPVVRFRTTSLGQGAYMAMPIFGRFMQKRWSAMACLATTTPQPSRRYPKSMPETWCAKYSQRPIHRSTLSNALPTSCNAPTP